MSAAVRNGVQVLFIPHGMHSFMEISAAAAALVGRGAQVEVFCEGHLDASATDFCDRHGIKLLGSAPEPDGTASPASRRTRRPMIGRLLGPFKAPIVSVVTFSRTWFAAARLRRCAKQLYAISRPHIVVSFNDRSGSLSSHLLALAKMNGGVTVLPPHEAINDSALEAISARRDSGFVVSSLPWSERLLGKVLGAIGFRVFASDGSAGAEAVFWLYPSAILAQACFGASSHNPWVRGGNLKIDRIAAATEHYKERLTESGVDETRIITVGYTRHDELAAACEQETDLRATLAERYGIRSDAPIVVFGLPYVAQYSYTTRDNLMADLRFVLDEVERYFPDSWILLARHPRTAASELSDLLGARRILLDTLSTYQAIAVSSIYLCSFSGTSYAALAAGRCLLSFDFYGSKTYEEFIGWTNDALHAYSREQLSRHLGQLADPQFRAIHMDRVRRNSRRYGILDGRCTDRLVSVILGDVLPETGTVGDRAGLSAA